MLDPETVGPRPSHPWRLAILSFLGGALSIILLLAVAYFGIRRFDASGRLPKRPTRPDAELAARSAADVRLRGDGDVEVRWIAVPQTWKPLNDEPFDRATMRLLADEGRRLGADPASWMTTAP